MVMPSPSIIFSGTPLIRACSTGVIWRSNVGSVGCCSFGSVLRILAYPRVNVAIFVESGRKIRSEEQTSELQSLMRNSYAVFCLKTKTTSKEDNTQWHTN